MSLGLYDAEVSLGLYDGSFGVFYGNYDERKKNWRKEPFYEIIFTRLDLFSNYDEF